MEIKGSVDRLHERQHDQNRRADSLDSRVIIDWLSPVNYHTQQDDFIKRRQEGTGTWLLNSDEFQAWLKISKQTLFCPGIPGAGKTMISSIVANHLETEFPNRANIGIAYLYCNYGQQQQQKTGDLLSNILKQLAQGQPSIPADVKKLYRQHVDKQTRPSFDDIIKVLHSTIGLYFRVFIVVDALDECQVSHEDCKKFLSEIFNLQAKAEVNIFATSRFVPEITKEFTGSVSLEIRASEEDVQRYLEGHMSQLPRCVSSDHDLQKEITVGIINAVDGMYVDDFGTQAS